MEKAQPEVLGRCKCGHHIASHAHGKDCLALLTKFGTYCRCKQFEEVPAKALPIRHQESHERTA